jgi:hypothetical protein
MPVGERDTERGHATGQWKSAVEPAARRRPGRPSLVAPAAGRSVGDPVAATPARVLRRDCHTRGGWPAAVAGDPSPECRATMAAGLADARRVRYQKPVRATNR